MGSDIRAGAAFVELYVKGSFQKDLADVQRKLKAFGDGLMSIGTKMMGIGAAISAPLIYAVHQFAALGDALNKSSQRTGIAVETLSALKFAADQSGLSFEELEIAVRKMEKSIFSFETGSKEATAAFSGIGLSVKDLKGLTPEQQLLKIADKLSKISDEGTRAAIAMEIFGKGGTNILPMVLQGAAGIAKLEEQARSLGLVMSKESAEAATKFHDTLKILNKQLGALVNVIGAAVANVLQPFATGAIRIMTNVINWAKENKNLVVGLIIAAVAITSAGAALIAFGIAVKTVLMITSAIATTWGAIGAAFTFLINPITLVCIGLATLGGYFIYTSNMGAKALSWLGTKFNILKETAMTAFGGIADALAAGDIQLAGQILWVGLQLLWAQGTQELMGKWIEFKYGFVKVAVAAFYGALECYQNVKASLINAWINTVAVFGDIWDGFISVFGNAWDAIINNVAKGIMWVMSLFTGDDYTEMAQAADDQLAQDQADRDKAAQDRIEQRAAQLEADLADVEKQRDDAIAALDDEATSIIGGADEAANQEINDLEQKKKALQDELASLRKKAGDEKAAIPDDTPLSADGLNLDDVLANREAVKPMAKSQGIFNAAAIQSLQSQSTEEYAKLTAKYTAETAKNTRNTAKFK